jgi:uncharacterized membrane protein YhiD involved in acid resistance
MENTVGFQDIIKKSVANMEFANSLSVANIVLILLVTFVTGMFIFYVYKKTFQGVLYTQSFNVSLVMVSIVTSLIIMTISSNFVLSLGMVGALSIVRFRTAIKDSMDIVFMFWAISVGITNGAGYFKISIVGSIVTAGVLFLLTRMRTNSAPYLLIVNYDHNQHPKIIDYLKKRIGKYNLKSKTVTNGSIEMTIEVRINNDDTNFVNELSTRFSVKDVVLVSYNGDYIS